MQSFTTSISEFESNLWSYHIKIPESVFEYFHSKKIKRLICTLNDKVEFHCAFMPEGEGRYFININKEVRNKVGLRIGDSVSVHLKEDKSKYGMPLPKEMEELLLQDELGDRYFHSLTPGKQRALLFLIGKPKSSDIRLKKALVILEYLKSVEGDLDFKELHQAIKESNEKDRY